MGDYWDQTISVLQPQIAKPVLKPALLQKPPFRFLHDIVTALMAATGFPQGLFPPAELEPEFVKAMDKDQKLAFLNRLQAAVQLAVGYEVDVSATKIIAGAEPEKTNALLQALAQAGQNAAAIDMNSIIAGVDGKPAGRSPAAAAPAAAAAASAAAAAAPAPKRASGNAGALRPTRAPISLPAAEGGEDFVGQTTRLIGALIQKPKMTDKLLRKPPFRFLHDIVTGVLAATTYPDGYFTPEELDSASFTETNAKLAFLQKLIDLVGVTNAVDLTQVNPKKIVAGLEPEHTNTMLQQLAYAAASGISAADAAKKLAQQGGGGGGGQAATAGAVSPPAPKDTRAEEAAAAAAEAERKARAAADAEQRKQAALAASQAQQQAQAAAAAVAAANKPMPKLGLSGIDNSGDESKQSMAAASSASAGGDHDDAPRSKVERPKTARKAPPKLASNLVEEKKTTNAASSSSSSSQPSKEEEKKQADLGGGAGVKLIAEGDNADEVNDDDDDDGPDGHGASDRIDLMGGEALSDFDDGAHGGSDGMVVKAMKDKLKGVATDGGGMKIRSSSTAVGGMSQAQLEELRRQIQSLCQSVNPLGKCIDFVREDVDAMNKELSRWRTAYQEYTEELDAERKSTERIVEPLQQQLGEVEAQIAEQQRKIHALKGTILRNDVAIQTLLDAKTVGAQ